MDIPTNGEDEFWLDGNLHTSFVQMATGRPKYSWGFKSLLLPAVSFPS